MQFQIISQKIPVTRTAVFEAANIFSMIFLNCRSRVKCNTPITLKPIPNKYLSMFNQFQLLLCNDFMN